MSAIPKPPRGQAPALLLRNSDIDELPKNWRAVLTPSDEHPYLEEDCVRLYRLVSGHNDLTKKQVEAAAQTIADYFQKSTSKQVKKIRYEINEGLLRNLNIAKKSIIEKGQQENPDYKLSLHDAMHDEYAGKLISALAIMSTGLIHDTKKRIITPSHIDDADLFAIGSAALLNAAVTFTYDAHGRRSKSWTTYAPFCIRRSMIQYLGKTKPLWDGGDDPEGNPILLNWPGRPEARLVNDELAILEGAVEASALSAYNKNLLRTIIHCVKTEGEMPTLEELGKRQSPPVTKEAIRTHLKKGFRDLEHYLREDGHAEMVGDGIKAYSKMRKIFSLGTTTGNSGNHTDHPQRRLVATDEIKALRPQIRQLFTDTGRGLSCKEIARLIDISPEPIAKLMDPEFEFASQAHPETIKKLETLLHELGRKNDESPTVTDQKVNSLRALANRMTLLCTSLKQHAILANSGGNGEIKR